MDLVLQSWKLAVTMTLTHLYRSPQSEAGIAGDHPTWSVSTSTSAGDRIEAVQMIQEDMKQFLQDKGVNEFLGKAKDWQGDLDTEAALQRQDGLEGEAVNGVPV